MVFEVKYCDYCGEEILCSVCKQECYDNSGQMIRICLHCIRCNLKRAKNNSLLFRLDRDELMAVLNCDRLNRRVKNEFKNVYVLQRLNSDSVFNE